MGTQGSYGGSPGWSSTQQDTADWLDAVPSLTGNGESGDSDGEAVAPEEIPTPGNEAPGEAYPGEDINAIKPAIANILSGVTGRLAKIVGSGTGSNTGSGGGSGGSAAPGGAREGTRRSRSATSGGAAIAGVYGTLARNSDTLNDIGLSLDELDDLSPFGQAQRLVKAASETAMPLDDDEIRLVNANFVLWALQHNENPPPPGSLVKAWVIEFVYRVWLTEAGGVLRNGSREGASTHALEQEVRATLEAAANRVDLPTTGLRAIHFQNAVQDLLGKLHRIFTEIAS